MKKYIYTLLIGISTALVGCDLFEIDEVTNPNAASSDVVASGASRVQIQALVSGLESRHRGYLNTTKNAFGTFGREILPYFDSDPRFTTDWLGRAGNPDAGFFAVANTYNAPYQAIKQANFLMETVAATDAYSEQEVNGLNGFAKTIQAYQYLVPWLAQWDLGIRIEVSDPLNPGPFLSRTESLAAIRALVDDAATDLGNAGSTFGFNLTSGFEGFDNPATFLEFNRALAARLAVYAEDWIGALTALNSSFLDLDGSLDVGPAHTYDGADGTAANPFNPFFFALDQFSTQIIVVHPSVLDDIEDGDVRETKFLERSAANAVTNQALVEYIATHQDGRWTTNQDNVPFLRNEELVLLYAEAQAQNSNSAEAVAAINKVRNDADLGDYTGATDTQSLINQILFERRFSLWHEPIGHRWVDLRRYDRLTDIEANFIVSDESVFTRLARPQGEVNWEENNGN